LKNLILLTFFCISTLTQAQNKYRFQEISAIAGSVVANYPNYPDLKTYSGLQYTFGDIAYDTKGNWGSFFNHPSVGLQVAAANVGNNSIFGNQFSVRPTLGINLGSNPFKRLDFEFGYGASYFTKFYANSENNRNKVIGSHLTWNFTIGLLKTVNISAKKQLRFGLQYIHASNGHTQLPNFGLNAMVAHLGLRFHKQEIPKDLAKVAYQKKQYNKHLATSLRVGVGMQELGGTDKPIGGNKYAVYTIAPAIHFVLNKQIHIRTGIAYRTYNSMKGFLSRDSISALGYTAKQNKNVFFFLASEWHLGHIAFDIEGGLNLYKPFYKPFFDTYERPGELDYKLKQLFNCRLGLMAFLFTADQNKTYNAFIAAHLSANFGQADFSEVSIGITRNF